MRTMAVLVGKNVLRASYAVVYAVGRLVRSALPAEYSLCRHHHGEKRTVQP